MRHKIVKPWQDDVCTELRRRAEQADLEVPEDLLLETQNIESDIDVKHSIQ